METDATDFTPWGLDANWPERRWLEPLHGRDGEPPMGLRLGHVSASAMVLICTFPSKRFDFEVRATGPGALREVAYETTYALINLALHQIRTPGARPGGLVGTLLSHAVQQANKYQDWPAVRWGAADARTTELASWQAGFSMDYPDVYVIVHACGVSIESIRLRPVEDLSCYEATMDPLEVGAMHWELWPSRPDVDYDELTRTLVAP
jgi:hypothetical protein